MHRALVATAIAVWVAACDAAPRAAEAGAPLDGCRGPGEARAVVRAFWRELDEHYAVFDRRLRGRSWDDVGRAACAAVGDDVSADSLLGVLTTMARTLDDGHIQITAPDLGRRETGWATGYAAGATMATLLANVERHYLQGKVTRAARDQFTWGRIGTIGYLHLNSFEALSPTVKEADDVAGARAAMTRALRDLRGVRGMIVDIRNNEGGWDDVGLEVARSFAGPRTLAYSKARRAGAAHDAYGPWVDVFVEASTADAFSGPVVVLISGWSFSAAETFALQMRVRPHVTILGERTSGHLSDLEPARLPNGWRYTYSSERYRAADGRVYEGEGVPVDVALAFDAAALAQGRDNMLEAAIARLRVR